MWLSVPVWITVAAGARGCGAGAAAGGTSPSRFVSRLPSRLSGVLPGGRRTTATACTRRLRLERGLNEACTTATAVWLARGLHEPFPLRIGAFAGDSNKEALAQEMADKTVLSMKVASGTGGVG